MMDVARYLAQYKKFTPGSPEYKEFMDQMEALEIVGIPLPTQKMPRFTPKYYTTQFIEERQDAFGEGVLKMYVALAIQTLILKGKGAEPQFEVIEGSLIDEYLKTLESEFESIDEKILTKLYAELTRKSRKQTEETEDSDETDDNLSEPEVSKKIK